LLACGHTNLGRATQARTLCRSGSFLCKILSPSTSPGLEPRRRSQTTSSPARHGYATATPGLTITAVDLEHRLPRARTRHATALDARAQSRHPKPGHRRVPDLATPTPSTALPCRDPADAPHRREPVPALAIALSHRPRHRRGLGTRMPCARTCLDRATGLERPDRARERPAATQTRLAADLDA